MFETLKKVFAILLAVSAFALVIGGCSGGADEDTTPAPGAGAGAAGTAGEPK